VITADLATIIERLAAEFAELALARWRSRSYRASLSLRRLDRPGNSPPTAGGQKTARFTAILIGTGKFIARAREAIASERREGNAASLSPSKITSDGIIGLIRRVARCCAPRDAVAALSVLPVKLSMGFHPPLEISATRRFSLSAEEPPLHPVCRLNCNVFRWRILRRAS